MVLQLRELLDTKFSTLADFKRENARMAKVEVAPDFSGKK